MQESPITLKKLLFTFLVSVFILLAVFVAQITDKRTKIVFCDVGQGDAAYIRVKNRVDILIDAGPNRQVLRCLGKYMPFWDRQIELAFITHQDLDHYGGFIYIIDRYKIDRLISVDSGNSSKTYRRFEENTAAHNINLQFNFLGDTISVLNDRITFLWPPEGLKTNIDNDYSLVFIFQEKDKKVLFTGDASPRALQKLVQFNSEKHISQLRNVDILKVPHHGSVNGLTSSFLKLADPKVAVISVGLNNPYGHPNKQILDLLKAKNIQIKRTDNNGDIKFILEELTLFP